MSNHKINILFSIMFLFLTTLFSQKNDVAKDKVHSLQILLDFEEIADKIDSDGIFLGNNPIDLVPQIRLTAQLLEKHL